MFKNLQELKDYICDTYNDEADNITIFTTPSYVNAFIGVSHDLRAVYDYNLMVEYLVKQDSMTTTEAIEFIDYNTIRSLPYRENSPIILYKI